MKSLKIISDERFGSSLLYVKRRFEAIDSTLVEVTDDGLEISCTFEKNSNEIQAIIKDIISEIVVTDCKAYFIKSNINLPTHDQIGVTAFLCALCEFDRSTDKLLATSLIKLSPVFVIGSFYDFCLDVLKNRWSEVCMLANENLPFLCCPKTFSELLGFLISNVESAVSEVYLKHEKKGVTVVDRHMKPIDHVYVNEALPNELKVISILVSLNPRRIFMLDEDCQLYQRIAEIFGSNVARKPIATQDIKTFFLY
ncbi:MAG: hypothetical protein FWE45_03150 [Firmicutes bacterium]|nr:hypothetical protein [Bacillota bacterium]